MQVCWKGKRRAHHDTAGEIGLLVSSVSSTILIAPSLPRVIRAAQNESVPLVKCHPSPVPLCSALLNTGVMSNRKTDRFCSVLSASRPKVEITCFSWVPRHL
jgi:hypothetical protein